MGERMELNGEDERKKERKKREESPFYTFEYSHI
jgi:hypothetical protein